jgi:SAM-dependent methyltransferase
MTGTAAFTTHTGEPDEAPRDHHLCPVWVGRMLASPIRRFVENPTRIFRTYVTPGSTVVDVGCAMGFHSLDLARLVAPDGRVVCLDVQQKMLDGLMKRAHGRGLDSIVEPRLCSQDGLWIDDLAGRAELVLVFNVVHEATYPRRLLRECVDALRPGGRLLIAEPRGHVSQSGFDETITTALDLGLERHDGPLVWRSRTVMLARPE